MKNSTMTAGEIHIGRAGWTEYCERERGVSEMVRFSFVLHKMSNVCSCKPNDVKNLYKYYHI